MTSLNENNKFFSRVEQYLMQVVRSWFPRNQDGSLTWKARLRILVPAIFIGVFVAKYGGGCMADWLMPGSEDNHVFQSAVRLGLFGVIVGLGNWIIRSDDMQKRFNDTFSGQNELLFSNAVGMLFEKSDPNDNTVNIHGFKELVRLANKGLIEQERINDVTAAKHNLSGADLKNTKLMGFNLQGVRLMNTDLRGADLRSANLERVVFHDAKYDEYTIFPEGFSPEEYGMRKV